MLIGILGGSFNPVHIGHMMLASYLSQWGYVDEVWLTLSPRNPLKEPGDLLPDTKRLAMLSLACRNVPKGIDICDLELSMPRPSYTVNTLRALRERFPEHKFKIIIGSDNWQTFKKWREWETILAEFGVLVYPRPGYPVEDRYVDGMEVVNAPQVHISSTFIRNAISRGKDMNFFLPPGVNKYILDHKLYTDTK